MTPPDRPTALEGLLATVVHLSAYERGEALHVHIAAAMTQAADFAEAQAWVESSLHHLKMVSGESPLGAVEVRVSALHLVLGYIEFLEGRLPSQFKWPAAML